MGHHYQLNSKYRVQNKQWMEHGQMAEYDKPDHLNMLTPWVNDTFSVVNLDPLCMEKP